MPGKIIGKSYKDRRGQSFTVRSYKLSRVHLHSISGGGKLPLLMRCLSQLARHLYRSTSLVILFYY